MHSSARALDGCYVKAARIYIECITTCLAYGHQGRCLVGVFTTAGSGALMKQYCRQIVRSDGPDNAKVRTPAVSRMAYSYIGQ